MTNSEFERIAESRIFSGCDRELLAQVLNGEGCEIIDYAPSESICEPQTLLRKIGIILKGSAIVLSADSDRKVLLRRFSPGDIFGVSSVFSDESEFVSRISAKSACTVAFIDAPSLSLLLENDKAVLYNYIGFLSDRIRFLNRRIANYTEDSADERLLYYIREHLDKDGEFSPPGSMTELAHILHVGRSSLYRAFEHLAAQGFLEEIATKRWKYKEEIL